MNRITAVPYRRPGRMGRYVSETGSRHAPNDPIQDQQINSALDTVTTVQLGYAGGKSRIEWRANGGGTSKRSR